jgi:hypothetical protein
VTETVARPTFAEDSGADASGGREKSPLDLRIKRLLRELLSTHVESLLALLAEEGVAAEEQRRRMDGLVRALAAIRFEEDLAQGTRQVPLLVDASRTPPAIRLHRKLIAGIEDAEILRALHAPIAEILGLSPVGVGLVLHCRDERQLKNLVNQVARRDGERVRITQVAAIVEQRMQLFAARLDAVAEHFGDSVRWVMAGEDDFVAALGRAQGGWPDWEAIRDSAFIVGVIGELGEAVAGSKERSPSAELLVELCWESLELSAQSFLRHAAQQLRAHGGGVDLGGALRELADIVEEGSGESLRKVEEWPAFGELSKAWEGLFSAEQGMLAWMPGRRSTPPISVFDRLIDVLGICEPANLPWEAPLLAWSMREHHALRDLLVGFRGSLEQTGSAAGAEHFEIDAAEANAAEAALNVEVAPTALQAQVVRRGYGLPDDYGRLLARAMNACHRSMLARFEGLDESGQMRVLHMLRSAYDGYFGDAREVWARRFQAWKMWAPAEAFRALSTELRHVLGPAMLFDPFLGPQSAQLSPAPSFVLVAPRPEQFDRVLVHMPLAALRQSIHGAPMRVRLVDVRDAARCAWVGDVEITMPTIEEHPTGVVLEAIENDSVRLLVYNASEFS